MSIVSKALAKCRMKEAEALFKGNPNEKEYETSLPINGEAVHFVKKAGYACKEGTDGKTIILRK